MSDDLSKRRLGRGLAALIGEMDQPLPVGDSRPSINPDRTVPIEFVARNPKTPAAISTRPNCRIWPVRSASMASSSRSWCERAKRDASKS
ncbi:hypothetical protein D3C72_2118390 [compost metagenome]